MLPEAHAKKIRGEIVRAESNLPYIFRALGDTSRFKMFVLLASQGGLCVTDIANIFSISVPAASHQLKILETAELVRRERVGQMICYEIRTDKIAVRFLTKIISTSYAK